MEFPLGGAIKEGQEFISETYEFARGLATLNLFLNGSVVFIDLF